MEELGGVLRALSDPTRARLLNIMSREALCVGDLQKVLALPQPFISRHLAYLRKAGLACDCRRGQRVVYSIIRTHPLGLAIQTFLREAARRSLALRADLGRLADYEGAGRLKSSRFRPRMVEENSESQNPSVQLQRAG